MKNTDTPTRKDIRVVIADDHASVRRGIQIMLLDIPGISVVGEAKDGLQALNMVDKLSPDVLILDVEMPVMNGLQVAATLQETNSPVRVIAISAYNDLQYISGMLDYGVTDYILKDDVPTKLIKAIRKNAAEVLG